MNFFSFVQQASMEKNHSAALAWIMSDSNLAIDSVARRKFVSTLAEIDIKGNLLHVFLEYKNIDILLVYDDCVVAIENKIKISEHSSQLEKYNEILASDFKVKRVVKLFLSLVGESPSDASWVQIDYDKVLTELSKISCDSEIIADYLSNLSMLVNCKNEFLANHCNYPNVFLDGYKRKYEKKSAESALPSAKYISENGLETVLQKAFFLNLVQNIEHSFEHLIIKETRRTALVDFKNPTWIKKLSEIDGECIDIGIQIQGTSLKVQFENGLDSAGKRKKNSTGLREILNKYIPNMYYNYKLKMYDKTLKDSGWRLNPPRSPKSNYYSISKKIPFPEGKAGFLDTPSEECREIIKSSIKESREIIDEAYSYLTGC
jgi:hypothetical protein